MGILSMLGCKKPCDLPEQHGGEGLIISNAIVSYPERTLITRDMQTTHRINSADENVFDLMVRWDNGAELDSIDFSKYTVLGSYAWGGDVM